MQTNKTAKTRDIAARSGTVTKDPNHILKMGIWLYFYLWIFEGALRKWFLPQLSMPLLIVRDPIVLWLIFLAYQRGLFKPNFYLTAIVALGVLSFGAAMFMGHGDKWVAIYGARTMLLYFPMMFVIGNVFNQADVLKMGKVLLWIAIPMTVLLVLQFYSPQTAWVNRGVGGDEEGAGFGGALGYFRPPGTFSFTNGTTCFYSILAPFIIYYWLTPKKLNKYILLLATGALLVAIPTSISRGLFLQVGVSVVFMLIAISRNPKYFGKVFIATVLVVVAFALFSNVGFFQTATEAFTSRFENANESEGGLVEGTIGNRFFGALIKAISFSTGSMVGMGVGSGTPLGALLLKDDTVARTADFEWLREIGEMGVMGLGLIMLRVGLTLKIAVASYHKLKKDDMLPWLLFSIGALVISQGQLHQPTILGFCALVGGLCMASFKSTVTKKTIVRKKKTGPVKQFSPDNLATRNPV
ncbi:MAG: hypothetical protein ABIN67_16935 [Ferruginibacter sp.]